MKRSSCFSLALLVSLQILYVGSSAQSANTALSNLTATSANVDFIPNATNARSIGSSAKSWKNLYLGNLLYMGGARFLTFTSAAGLNNTGLGVSSLLNNSTGYSNTALGASTLHSNTTGFNNVGIGYGSLFYSASGHNNVGIGALTLYKNSTGVSNSAMGNSALTNNTTGNNNMAIGANALGNNTTGTANIGIGNRAMFNNKTLSYQVAIGDSALFSNTDGDGQNTAVGSKALYSLTSGSANTAVGFQANQGNVKGSATTAIGYRAMAAADNAVFSTAIGYLALANAVGFSDDNTAIGGGSLNYVVSGSSNTGLGCYTDVNYDYLYDATMVGYGAQSSASNMLTLGGNSNMVVRGTAPYTDYSDGRFKTSVTENVPGLTFIKKLRPVTYHYNIHGMNEHMGVKTQHGTHSDVLIAKAADEKEKIWYSGFIAQEVEKIADSLHYNFSGVYKPQNDKDLYGLSYASFVVPLVKSVQQLNDTLGMTRVKNDSLTRVVDSLVTGMSAMQQRLDRLEAALHLAGASADGGSLSQNTPNPVHGSTSIGYFLPQTFGRAKIQVTDMNGRVLKTIPLSGSGRGLVTLNTSTLAAGSYLYALYIDGSVTGSKQMLVVR